MPSETNLQIAGRIAIETVTRYLPDESPDVGRGRRCLEFLESQIEAALDAEREHCAKIAETAFTEYQTGYNAGKWIAAAIRGSKQ